MSTILLHQCDICKKEVKLSNGLPNDWFEFYYLYSQGNSNKELNYLTCSFHCYIEMIERCLVWSNNHSNVLIAGMTRSFAIKLIKSINFEEGKIIRERKYYTKGSFSNNQTIFKNIELSTNSLKSEESTIILLEKEQKNNDIIIIDDLPESFNQISKFGYTDEQKQFISSFENFNECYRQYNNKYPNKNKHTLEHQFIKLKRLKDELIRSRVDVLT